MIELPDTDRVWLAEAFHRFGYRVGAEIGVEQGKYAEVLCKANPGLKLYCVDPWEAYQGYREHVSQDKLDTFYDATKNRLAEYNVELIRQYSLDAAQEFADGSLDFVYIDANHQFEHVVADIAAWLPKVKVGGVISGHDFIRKKNMNFGVVEAVEGYCRAYGIEFTVLGRKEVREGERRDRSRSWFWVKQ